MISLLKHLFPRSRAWLLNPDKNLYKFLSAFEEALSPAIKEYLDYIFLDQFPATTRDISKLERSTGIVPNTNLTDNIRRQRLAGRFAMVGGASPYYLEKTVRDAGFDLRVHESWDFSTDPPTLRDPRTVLGTTTGFVDRWTCDDLDAQCDDVGVQCDDPLGQGAFVLVNKPERDLTVPSDPATWPYFIYFGGPDFGETANIDPQRKEELENLLLSICPCHNWIGMIVNYTLAPDSFILLEDGSNLLLEDGNQIGLE